MPMPGQYCFLCVSDEGVFLDITEDNRSTICKQLEACSLDPELAGSANEILRNICHKCAYELEQCSTFVSKLKKTLNAKRRTKVANKICVLCLESGNKSYLFDLEEDNCSIETTILKIKSFFDHDVYEDDNRLICLSCRYRLDVLYDIKSIYQNNLPRLQNIAKEDLNYSLFPKTKTRVVKRKTTTTESDSICAISISSSDSETNMPRKKQTGAKVQSPESLPGSNLQSCNECHNTYKSGTDVYRIHKTGNTICKKCWMSIDRVIENSKTVKTKVCSVFLKDVLRDSIYTKDKIYKVEEDSDGNKTYIVKDPEKKDKPKLGRPKMKRTASLEVSSTLPKRATRGAKTSADSTDSDDKTSKKSELPKNGNISKISTNEKIAVKRTRTRTIIVEESTNVRTMQMRTRKREVTVITGSLRKAISDTEQVKSKKRSLRKAKHTVPSKTDVSEESANEGVSTRKRRKIIKADTDKNGENILNKTAEADSSNSDIEVISVTDASEETNEAESKTEILEGITAIEDEAPKTRRGRRTQSVEPPAVTVKDKNKTKTSLKKDVEAKGRRSNSVSSSETVEGKTKRTRSGSVLRNDVPEGAERKKRRENTPPSQEVEPETVDIAESSNGEESILLDDDKPHTCKVCEKVFDTRLLGLTHELSHHKKLEVKLHRRELTEVDSEIKNEVDDKVITIEGEDTSENIAIRLDDDEEAEPVPVEDVSTVPEKVNIDPSDEVKVVDDLPIEIPTSPAKKDANDTVDQSDKSPKKTDAVQNTSIESNEIKTAEVLEDSTKETPNSDATTEESNENNTTITEEKDSNKEPELPEETKESSDNTEKDKESKSKELDEPEVEKDKTKENNIDKIETIVEESKDVPTVSPRKNVNEDEDKTSEKQKDIQTRDEEPKSKADTPTKTENILENNTEKDEDEPQKTIETSPDKVENEIQAEVDKKSEEAKTEKDSCDIATNKTTVTDSLQLLEENGTKVNDIEIDAHGSPSEKIATEVLQEVFDLAAAEVQKRQDSSPNSETVCQEDVETLENISREIQNSGDLKSMDTETKNKNDTASNEVCLE